jgi:hypothetical protein
LALVALHAAGLNSGGAHARASSVADVAEGKHFVLSGRAQPGYRESDFRPQLSTARRETHGGAPDRYAPIPVANSVTPDDRRVVTNPSTVAAPGQCAEREWNRARAPPLRA